MLPVSAGSGLNRDRQSILPFLDRKVRIGIHSRHEDTVRVWNIHLNIHGSGRGLDVIADTSDLAGENSIQRGNMHRESRPNPNLGNHRFRHRHDQPQAIDLSDANHRHGLRLRRRPGLDHRTRIGETFRHHSGKRGDDLRVIRHSSGLLLFCPGGFHLQNRGIERRLGGRNLSVRGLFAGERFIQLLLRDQAFFLLGNCNQPCIGDLS